MLRGRQKLPCRQRTSFLCCRYDTRPTRRNGPVLALVLDDRPRKAPARDPLAWPDHSIKRFDTCFQSDERRRPGIASKADGRAHGSSRPVAAAAGSPFAPSRRPFAPDSALKRNLSCASAFACVSAAAGAPSSSGPSRPVPLPLLRAGLFLGEQSMSRVPWHLFQDRQPQRLGYPRHSCYSWDVSSYVNSASSTVFQIDVGFSSPAPPPAS
jgi:hypothetical protein